MQRAGGDQHRLAGRQLPPPRPRRQSSLRGWPRPARPRRRPGRTPSRMRAPGSAFRTNQASVLPYSSGPARRRACSSLGWTWTDSQSAQSSSLISSGQRSGRRDAAALPTTFRSVPATSSASVAPRQRPRGDHAVAEGDPGLADRGTSAAQAVSAPDALAVLRGEGQQPLSEPMRGRGRGGQSPVPPMRVSAEVTPDSPGPGAPTAISRRGWACRTDSPGPVRRSGGPARLVRPPSRSPRRSARSRHCGRSGPCRPPSPGGPASVSTLRTSETSSFTKWGRQLQDVAQTGVAGAGVVDGQPGPAADQVEGRHQRAGSRRSRRAR